MKECPDDEADKVIITVLHNAPETEENVCVQFDELEDLAQSKGSISFVTLTDGEDFATENIFRSCTSENFTRNLQTLYKIIDKDGRQRSFLFMVFEDKVIILILG